MRSRFGSYTEWLCARAPEIYAAFMGICAGEFFETTKALLSGTLGRQKAKVERKALLAAAGPPPLVF
jgi:hypothetical protein